MNKSNINEQSAQTEADSTTNAENQQVSQPNANTNVVGSLLGQREIKFKYIFKTYDGRFIVEIFTLKELEYGGLQNFLSGLHDIIIVSKCQYTGLKDKNGKERFEGDIIKRSTGYIFVEKVIEFRMGDRNCATCFGYNYHKDDEVAGNIFENPELLQTLR